MTEGEETNPQGIKKETVKPYDFGFGMFQVELSSHLSHDAVQKLATIFNFSASKFDKVKQDSLAFVRILRDEGIITPTDISSLINALQSSNQEGIAAVVQKSFEKNQMRDVSVPRTLTPELKRKHSLLVSALKEVYRQRYNGVKPTPFRSGIWRCVNDIFVESKIEVLDNSKSTEDPTRWSSIKSRHEIFTNPSFEKHISIEGEPGFGKSMLLLQYAHDWCTLLTESPLKSSHILILLRLKDLTDASSIFNAIEMMLPKDSQITFRDIKGIVTSGHWKVVLAFDGYDEYVRRDNMNTDISKIMQGDMLTACIVIITTRPSCIPSLESPIVTRCRMTGFDRDMQEKYIDKAVTSRNARRSVKELIIRKLKEHDVFTDICQVPLFFTTFVHLNNTGDENQRLNSVTSYFPYMVTTFLSHLRNKALKHVLAQTNENPTERLQIAKLAFDGLSRKENKLLWRQDELLNLLETSCYNRYVSAGILLEEEGGGYKVIPGQHADDQIEVTTYVRFFHKTFQEFYAAHFIAHLAETQDADYLKKALRSFDLYNYQYVIRFACGLKPTAAKIAQYYLNDIGNHGKRFSVLCMMEQETGAFDTDLAQLCSEVLPICHWHNRLLQRSTIQLLQTAAHRNIQISRVVLWYCFQSVNLEEESLCLSFGFQLPRLDTLQTLVIWHKCDLRERARDILYYSGKCIALKTLKFVYVLLPQSFDDKDVQMFRRRNFRVEWRTYYYGLVKLNLQTGKWEKNDGQEMTDDEYLGQVNVFQRLWQHEIDKTEAII